MENETDMLNYETVLPILKEALARLSSKSELDNFRLVGGTNLSLRFGHRMSDDIDFFTPQEYGTVDFEEIYRMLRDEFDYIDGHGSNIGSGNSYYIGNTSNDGDKVKLDLMYTDPFLNEPDEIDGVRFASVQDIVAMKLNAISDGDGRKKDFWDIHFLLTLVSLKEMLDLHEKRHPWEHDRAKLLIGYQSFCRPRFGPFLWTIFFLLPAIKTPHFLAGTVIFLTSAIKTPHFLAGTVIFLTSAIKTSHFVDRTAIPPYNHPYGNTLMQIVTGGSMDRWNIMMQAYMTAIAGSRRYAYIQSPYFIPPETLMRVLQNAASSGVDVRIMIPYRGCFGRMNEDLFLQKRIYTC